MLDHLVFDLIRISIAIYCANRAFLDHCGHHPNNDWNINKYAALWARSFSILFDYRALDDTPLAKINRLWAVHNPKFVICRTIRDLAFDCLIGFC